MSNDSEVERLVRFLHYLPGSTKSGGVTLRDARAVLRALTGLGLDTMNQLAEPPLRRSRNASPGAADEHAR